MDLISDLLPAVPSLELDPTSPYQNGTLLTNTFIGAFLGTFIANLAFQTVRSIIGESVIIFHLIQHSFIEIISSDRLKIFFFFIFSTNIDVIIFQTKTS